MGRGLRQAAVASELATPVRGLTTIYRRNVCELAIRDRLGTDPGIYVNSSKLDEDHPARPIVVSVIARDELACKRAEQLLADVAGFDDWSERWTALTLGDWKIRLWPELTSALSSA